jgi:hypothetical protein
MTGLWEAELKNNAPITKNAAITHVHIFVAELGRLQPLLKNDAITKNAADTHIPILI